MWLKREGRFYLTSLLPASQPPRFSWPPGRVSRRPSEGWGSSAPWPVCCVPSPTQCGTQSDQAARWRENPLIMKDGYYVNNNVLHCCSKKHFTYRAAALFCQKNDSQQWPKPTLICWFLSSEQLPLNRAKTLCSVLLHHCLVGLWRLTAPVVR